MRARSARPPGAPLHRRAAKKAMIVMDDHLVRQAGQQDPTIVEPGSALRGTG